MHPLRIQRKKDEDMKKIKSYFEYWKDIKGYEGLYQISNLKRVKSLPRMRVSKGGCLCPVPEKILSLNKIDKDGYIDVTLSKDGKLRTYRLSRLMAQAFIPNPKHLPCVNHKDENKQNNSISNLEWCTTKYNIRYSKHKVSHKLTYKGKTYPSIRACGRNNNIDIHTIRYHLKLGTPYNGGYFVKVQ